MTVEVGRFLRRLHPRLHPAGPFAGGLLDAVLRIDRLVTCVLQLDVEAVTAAAVLTAGVLKHFQALAPVEMRICPTRRSRDVPDRNESD